MKISLQSGERQVAENVYYQSRSAVLKHRFIRSISSTFIFISVTFFYEYQPVVASCVFFYTQHTFINENPREDLMAFYLYLWTWWNVCRKLENTKAPPKCYTFWYSFRTILENRYRWSNCFIDHMCNALIIHNMTKHCHRQWYQPWNISNCKAYTYKNFENLQICML